MGFAVSWFAVQGQWPSKVLEALGLSPTGRREEVPDSKAACAALGGGWFLVYVNQFHSPLLSERRLRGLSAGGRVVACQVEEHIMYSSAEYYENGRKVWRVEHDAHYGIYHLVTEGRLPAGFQALYDGLRRQQEARGGEASTVDFIHDVPVALAESVARFRHDAMPEGAPADLFEELGPVEP